MLVMECASAVPSFWQSEALCTAVPCALLYCLELQPSRPLRLSVHHGLIPLVKSCPVECAQKWLAALMAHLTEFLPGRLGGMWKDMQSKLAGDVGGAKSKQTEDEIIQEACFQAIALAVARPMANDSACISQAVNPTVNDHFSPRCMYALECRAYATGSTVLSWVR
jgi:hypothetical protein